MKKTQRKLTPEQEAHFAKAHQEEEANLEQTKAQARELFASVANTPRVIAVLIQARHDAGLTVEEVARRMGAPRPSISRLEATTKASGNPTLKTLAAYAAAVGVDLRVSVVAPAHAPESGRHRRDVA
jgi:DNA-binding XRE family transcriptional regulator